MHLKWTCWCTIVPSKSQTLWKTFLQPHTQTHTCLIIFFCHLIHFRGHVCMTWHAGRHVHVGSGLVCSRYHDTKLITKKWTCVICRYIWLSAEGVCFDIRGSSPCVISTLTDLNKNVKWNEPWMWMKLLWIWNHFIFCENLLTWATTNFSQQAQDPTICMFVLNQ